LNATDANDATGVLFTSTVQRTVAAMLQDCLKELLLTCIHDSLVPFYNTLKINLNKKTHETKKHVNVHRMDSRTPDLLLQGQRGLVFTPKSNRARAPIRSCDVQIMCFFNAA
jgi:hypothetical protein